MAIAYLKNTGVYCESYKKIYEVVRRLIHLYRQKMYCTKIIAHSLIDKEDEMQMELKRREKNSNIYIYIYIPREKN